MKRLRWEYQKENMSLQKKKYIGNRFSPDKGRKKQLKEYTM